MAIACVFIILYMQALFHCVSPSFTDGQFFRELLNEPKQSQDTIVDEELFMCEKNLSCNYVTKMETDKEYQSSLFHDIESKAMLLSTLKKERKYVFRDCKDAYEQGVTQNGIIEINLKNNSTVKVYCNMVVDGGGWIVFQRREDNSTSFYRGWNEFVQGFGSLAGNTWLGLETLHMLTDTGEHTLRIDLVSENGNKGNAIYENFKVFDSGSNYRLQLGAYTGNIGDSLTGHNGMSFSTADNDNDQRSSENMAIVYGGPWWYGHEYKSNLNNFHMINQTLPAGSMVTISWFSWASSYGRIKFTEMKLRRKD